jgi:PPM family protein phosphatase
MRSAYKSDQGLVRENNEDYILADQGHGIFMLADGMGGGPGGEVASELAVTTAHRSILQRLEQGGSPLSARVLAEALAAAHSAVAKRALADSSLHGMGTTLEIVAVRGAEAETCHIGDSRIYQFRHGLLRQLTTDDNYAAMVAEVGDIPLEEIPPAYKHILTQALGVSDQLVPEFRSIEFKPGDLLLICSDGLTGALEEHEIAEILTAKAGDLAASTEALVDAANAKGGADNVSIIIVEPVPALAAASLPAAG